MITEALITMLTVQLLVTVIMLRFMILVLRKNETADNDTMSSPHDSKKNETI